MARSESTVTEADPEEYHIEYVEGCDETRLVVTTDRVTVTIEGETEEVRRQFEDYQAVSLGLSPGALEESAEEYPMPVPEELDSVPAAKFYDEQ